MSIEERVGNLEREVATVKTYVTNHIPHAIADLKDDIAHLYNKVKPLETKNLKSQGVHEFLNITLKTGTIVVGLLWTTIMFAEKFHWFGL